MNSRDHLLRAAIFYDGNFFYHVSNYYCYTHQRHARLSIPGLHDFIRKLISEKEGVSERFCQIVDCHYFRGRLSASEAHARQLLFNERVFDDILMREGVVTHYLPMNRNMEKGVDVSLALETLELTIFKKFDVVVLIASDGDYVPLVRKLNALGTRVVVLGWDFDFYDESGNQRSTVTSARLMNEASYPVHMQEIIDGTEKLQNYDFDVDSLFVQSRFENFYPAASAELNEEMSYTENYDESVYGSTQSAQTDEAKRQSGRIVHLKDGYGFLEPADGSKSLFFFCQDLENCEYSQLSLGDEVEYEIGTNDRGPCAKKIIKPAQQG